MNRGRILVGVLLVILGFSLGISANADREIETGKKAWGKTVAALCLTLVGSAVLVREGLATKKTRSE